MTSEYLRYFIEACKCGSIQNASKALFVSAQGIGQGIQRLENQIGVQLLERTKSGVHPTKFGELFLEQACVAYKEIQKLEELAENFNRENNYRITIGVVGVSKFQGWIVTCADAYCAQQSGMPVDISIVSYSSGLDITKGVRSGELDIGLLFHSRESSALKYCPVSEYSRLMLLVSMNHALAKQESVAWEQMKGLDFITAGENDPFSSLLSSICFDHGFVPNNIIFSTENSFVSRLVENNVVAQLLRESYFLSNIMQFSKNAVALPVVPEVRIANSIVTNAKAESREMRAFVNFMVDYFRNTSGQ